MDILGAHASSFERGDELRWQTLAISRVLHLCLGPCLPFDLSGQKLRQHCGLPIHSGHRRGAFLRRRPVLLIEVVHEEGAKFENVHLLFCLASERCIRASHRSRNSEWHEWSARYQRVAMGQFYDEQLYFFMLLTRSIVVHYRGRTYDLGWNRRHVGLT